MQSIGTIAALDATGVSQLNSHLPWGWFALMAIMDVALAGVVIARRLRARSVPGARDGGRPSPEEVLVLRDGWWVPRSRVPAVPDHRASYPGPLHCDYMVRGSAEVRGDGEPFMPMVAATRPPATE